MSLSGEDDPSGADMRGCHFQGSYEQWKLARDGFVPYVRDANDVLDIGCANGFLLKSLIEWSERAFTPWGIDIREHSIEAARTMFPDHAGNFSVTDMADPAWTERRFDVVLAPFFEFPEYLATVGTYLAKHPDSSVVFSVYDDEMDRFEGMVTTCRDRFPVVDQITLRDGWCGLLRVRAEQ